MGSAMTLEQVRDWHLARQKELLTLDYVEPAKLHRTLADAIDVHLADKAGARVDGWMPIESAPKDGRELWLFDGDQEPSQFVGFYADDPNGPYWAYSEQLVMDVVGVSSPTHWMPLPPGPTV